MFSNFYGLILAVTVVDTCLGYVIKEEKGERFGIDQRELCDQCYIGNTTCASPAFVRQSLLDVDSDGSCLRCAQKKCRGLAKQGAHPRVLSDCWARSWYRDCSLTCGEVPDSFLERESGCRVCLRNCSEVSMEEDYEIVDIRTCVRTCIRDETCPNKEDFFTQIDPLMTTDCGMCISGLCQNTFSNYGILTSVTCYNNAVEKCGDCENLSPQYDMTECGTCLQGCKSAIKGNKDNKRKDNKELANNRATLEMEAEGSSMM